jgi:hypothetical protein
LSLIGEHTGSTSGWTSRCGILKAFNSGPGVLQAGHPDAVRFYRAYMGEWSDRDGGDTARQVIAQLAGYRHPKLYIELYVGPPQDEIAAICDQIEQALPVAHAAGVGLAAFSFYTGQPERSVWDYAASRNWCGLDPALDCISVQEYTNNGTVNNPVNVGRFTALIDAGWTGPIAITEAGYDSAGTPQSGWQSALTMDEFYAYLRSYDALLAGYTQVLGATVFNAPGWPSFDFHDPRGQFNYSGATPVATPKTEPEQEQEIQTNFAQVSDLTEALRRIRQGKWTGADGVDGMIVALQGGKPLDFTPTFP